MRQDAELRVERALERIARRGVLGDGLVLGLASTDRRQPQREEAEHAVAIAGRDTLVISARDRVHSALNDLYGNHALGSMFGSPGDVASAEQRAAIALALDDLVLAVAAEDLIGRASFRALSQDGEALLGRRMSPAAAYQRAGIPIGGKIDPVATPWAKAQLIAGVAAAIILGPVAFLFAWSAYGTPVGIAVGLAIAGTCAAWAVWPRRRPPP